MEERALGKRLDINVDVFEKMYGFFDACEYSPFPVLGKRACSDLGGNVEIC